LQLRPLPLFHDLRIRREYDFPHLRKRPSAPVAQFLDLRVNGGRASGTVIAHEITFWIYLSLVWHFRVDLPDTVVTFFSIVT